MTIRNLVFLSLTACMVFFQAFAFSKEADTKPKEADPKPKEPAPKPVDPDLKVDIFGFVKAEVIFADRINKFSNQPDIFPVGVPYDDERRFHHGESIWDARNSRIGVMVSDKYCDINMKGLILLDFATEDGNALITNPRRPRLYYAYARADLPDGLFLLAGQFWSIFYYRDFPIPTSISNQPVVGAPFSRQPQFCLGYKYHFCELDSDLQLEADVEKHSFNDVGFPLAPGISTSQGCEEKYPLFAAKVSWLSKKFNAFIVAGGTQSMTVFDEDGDESRAGVWGVEGVATYRWRNLLFCLQLHHLEGLNRIFFENFPDMAIDAAGNLHPVHANGGSIGLRWDWIEDILWFNIFYGYDHATEIPGTTETGSLQETYREIRTSIFYNFWKHWQFAVEYERVNVRAFNGRKGHEDVIHSAIWYYFGKIGENYRIGR